MRPDATIIQVECGCACGHQKREM